MPLWGESQEFCFQHTAFEMSITHANGDVKRDVGFMSLKFVDKVRGGDSVTQIF